MQTEKPYITSRRKDAKMAEQVGRFMDEYFYSKLGEEWKRVADSELQQRGVDVVFGDCKIDEKINRVYGKGDRKHFPFGGYL